MIKQLTKEDHLKTLTPNMTLFTSLEDSDVIDFGGRVTKPSKKNFQLVLD